MAFCNQCGKELNEGVKFCGSCGTPVAPGASQTTETTEKPIQASPIANPEREVSAGKKSKLFLAASVVGALIFIGLSGFCLYLIEEGSMPYTHFIGYIFHTLLLIAFIFNFIVLKKSNGKNALIAGILYLISIYGIPSAALFFLDYCLLLSKQKKQNG